MPEAWPMVSENELQQADILLCRGSTTAAAVIRNATNSWYSHAMLCVTYDAVIEAIAKVERTPMTTVKQQAGKLLDVFRHPEMVNSAKQKIAVETAEKLLNKEYNLTGTIRSGLNSYIPWPSGTNRDQTDEAQLQSVFCSELVTFCYQAAGIELFPGKKPVDFYPGMLAAPGTSLTLVGHMFPRQTALSRTRDWAPF